MRVTGLCGGIGAGKSTVAAVFAETAALAEDAAELVEFEVEPLPPDMIATEAREPAPVILTSLPWSSQN